ncbi:MAG: hypothetical protein IRZ16_15805 [Myxococcaceae bacterium]|nr:hypothetical protein [Myxococcaceae bacterium]
MPVTSPDALGLCCELADAAAVLAPRGWKKIEVGLDNRGGQLRVTGLDARLDAAPPPKPELGMDPAARMGGMSAAFTDLLHLLHHEGVDWDGARATLSRPAPDQLVVTLFNRDARPASSISVPREFLDALFLSDTFLAALAEAEPRLEAAQKALEARLSGYTGWSYSQPERRVTFQFGDGRPALTVAAQLLGTWSPDDESWLWAWANSSVEPGCTELVEKAVNPDAHAPGLAALWRERFPCEPGFATKIALLAADRAGAKGVFRGRVGDTVAYLALME